jgi:hypothetical protein
MKAGCKILHVGQVVKFRFILGQFKVQLWQSFLRIRCNWKFLLVRVAWYKL